MGRRRGDLGSLRLGVVSLGTQALALLSCEFSRLAVEPPDRAVEKGREADPRDVGRPEEGGEAVSAGEANLERDEQGEE